MPKRRIRGPRWPEAVRSLAERWRGGDRPGVVKGLAAFAASGSVPFGSALSRLVRPRLVLPVLLLAAAGAIFLYLRATRPEATPAPAEERARPVAAVEARYVDVRPPIVEFGAVVAGSVVELRPLVAGRIAGLGPGFVEGAVVREGETLVVIDRFDYEVEVADKEAAVAESRARLKEARAELDAERRLLAIAREQAALRMTDLERKRELNERGTLSRKARDDATIAANEAKRSVEAAEQRLERLAARIEQSGAALARAEAALKRARRDLDETLLAAPEDGYLADVAAAAGQRVGTGDRLARLIVARRLEVSFQLKRSDFGRLADGGGGRAADRLLGRTVSVTWRVGPREFVYDAVIERLDAEIDPAGGGIGVRARLVDPDPDAPLRPGAFVEVGVPGELYRGVLRLPEGAVDGEGNVYVIEEGRLSPRRVELLRRMGKDVLVRGDIAPGARIVTTSFPEIGPGQRVEAR